MTTPFIGQITAFPFGFAPRGWVDCAGQDLPINQNVALFALLGTRFGGNGSTFFRLPDLRGRVPVGFGSGPGLTPYAVGDTGGAEDVTLTGAALPAHSHSLNATTAQATTNVASGNLLATAQGDGSAMGLIYGTGAPDTPLASGAIGLTGGSQPHNNMQPYLVLRYCIAIEGDFPMRS
jgi:microcystin-dependent protein